MKRIVIVLSAVFLTSFNDFKDTVNEHIRKRVEDMNTGIIIDIQGEKLYCTRLVPDFYSSRLFEQAWTNDKNIREFLDELSRAEDSGLSHEDYHYGLLKDFSITARGPEEHAELDMLLTDAFLLYGSHLLNGKVNPETIDSEWKAMRQEGNMMDTLEKAIKEKEISKSLTDLEPTDPSYMGLKNTLKLYRDIADYGGWFQLPEGPTLKPGMQDSMRVPLLIQRLYATADMNFEPEDQYTYSESIAFSVKKYQKRNGLEEDGNLGKATTASMNISVEERIDQIRVNMERFRWISHDLDNRYVFVNIAGFNMHVHEGDSLIMQEKVIVGKPFRKTPIFSSAMTYLVLNPYWTVPPTILYNDIIPEVKKDIGYLAKKNMKILKGYGSDMVEIDATTIDWSTVSRGNFPYTIRQDPGTANALGKVKFMFPNKYDVYMHDTPSKELFNRPERTFSSGCIRLKNPMKFLEYLLHDTPNMNMEKANKILASGKEQTIVLKNPITVYIQYLTCWMEGDEVYFRKDVYNRDMDVLNALNERAPNL